MRPRKLRRWFIGPHGLRAGWGLLFFAAAWIGFTALLFIALPIGRGIAGDLGLFLAEAKLLASVVAASAALAWIEGRSLLSYGLGGPQPLGRALRGAFWGVALFSLLIGALLVSDHLALGWAGLGARGAAGYALAYALGFWVAALAEELLFRGYLQATLARIVGFWPAALLLSLAFGLVHRANPGESMLGVLNAALIGLALCLCLRLSGSLWWGIGFHAAWDWAESFLWGTPVSGYVLEQHVLHARALGDPLWSGGAAGPEASLVILPLLCLLAVVALRSFAPGALALLRRGLSESA